MKTATQILFEQTQYQHQLQAHSDHMRRMIDAVMQHERIYTVDGAPAIDTLPEHTHEHAEPAIPAPRDNAVVNGGFTLDADARVIGEWAFVESTYVLANGSHATAGEWRKRTDDGAPIDALPGRFRAAGDGEPATCCGYVGRTDAGAADSDHLRDALAYGAGYYSVNPPFIADAER